MDTVGKDKLKNVKLPGDEDLMKKIRGKAAHCTDKLRDKTIIAVYSVVRYWNSVFVVNFLQEWNLE